MSQRTIWLMGGTAAAATLGLLIASAEAQQPPAKAPTTSTAATTVAPKPAAKPKKAASGCSKLLETACKAKAECAWVIPTKANAKTGKVAAPYCRVKPKAKTAAAGGAAKPAAPKAGTAPPAK